MAPAFLAPAKINLTLEVLARRDDGYHGIRSVMVPLALADELQIEPAPAFTFSCDRPELEGSDNLALRALATLGALPAVRLALRKRIPTQAGLGGGSSDAAAVLRSAMAGAFGAPPHFDWLAAARSLGSDVPFFLAGTGALVEGTGERVTPLGTLPGWHVLVVKPPAAVSTAWAYAALDRAPRATRPRAGSTSLELLAALQRGDFPNVEALMHNDFEGPISEATPEIAAALAALRAAGAGNAMLAGSGSCVFTIARSADEIENVRQRLALGETFERFVTTLAATPQWRG
jgi:4-diphosphocytidyl-2-C-methyl-D-erythritol kinase